ncbi:MAG: type VI secretion system protein ImpF [Lentimonas sp.]|jgi:type VI secretion system protein ImpF
MADLISIDRLQPCLMDRLFDDEPRRKSESREDKVVSVKRFREGVKRDIEWLLNSKSRFYDLNDDLHRVRDSVLNYGIRDFTGLSSENLSLKTLENIIRNALIVYEPRLITDELEVKAVNASSEMKKINALSFEISGKIWAEPLPQDFVLRTEVSLDTGMVSVV